MPDNTYTAKTRLLAPVPRSKRMRDANVTVAQQSSSSQQVEQTWNRDTESVQDAEVLVPVAQPLIDILRLRNGNHIVNITVDNNGNLHVDAGLYSDSFISALGLNPDAPTPGGGGLDEDELWTILGGSSTNQHILSKYINNVAASAVQGLATVATSGSYNNLSNKPSSLPASDVYSWAKASTKPSYSWSEITGNPPFAPSEHTHNYAGSSSAGGNANAALALCGLNSSGAAQSGMTSRPTTANVTYADNKLRYYLATSSMTAGKPTNDAHIIHLPWDNGYYDVQLSVTHSGLAPFLQVRGQQGSSAYGSWSTILDSNNYSSYALPLSGGTMTGVLTLKANQYSGANGYGMNCNNSDLFNVNSIITADNAESFGEGIMFWRSSTPTYDCLTASGGTFYFGSNKAYGAALSGDANINCGSINVNQTAWDNGIVIKRTAVSGGAGIKALDSNNNVLGTFGINGSKQFEVDINSTQYALITSSLTQLGRTDISDYGLNIYSSTARLRLLAYSNGNTYIQSGNSAFTASADMHITGYNSNNVANLYLHANKLGVGQSSGLTTELDVYGTVRSRAYDANGNNHAAFVFDKPGSNLTGIGSNNKTDTIYFGACDAAGAWINYTQKWEFGGSVIAVGPGEHFVEAQDTTSGLRMVVDATNSQQGLWTNGYWNGSSLVSSNLWMLYRTTDGHIVLGTNTEVKGNLYATGAVTALVTSSSDRRLKTDIKEFDALSIVDMLKPKSFRWNSTAKALDSAFDTNDTQYGLIAQEVEEVMPSLAFKFKHNEYMGVRYEKLIPILLQAVKELKNEINELKK